MLKYNLASVKSHQVSTTEWEYDHTRIIRYDIPFSNPTERSVLRWLRDHNYLRTTGTHQVLVDASDRIEVRYRQNNQPVYVFLPIALR